MTEQEKPERGFVHCEKCGKVQPVKYRWIATHSIDYEFDGDEWQEIDGTNEHHDGQDEYYCMECDNMVEYDDSEY